MPYTPTVWTDGVTQGTHVNLGNLETQYAEATLSFEQDLFTPFVLLGLVATKDGSIANQLDVTAGTAFLKQPDGTLRRRAPVSTTFTTSAPSTTYYLDLNPDGTGLQWGTSHSGTANYLPICQVTTDGSGNIATVTDERQLNTSLLGGMAGSVSFSGGGVLVGTSLTGTSGTLPISSQQSGAANGISFKSWNGTAGVVPFSIGGQFNSALSWVDNSGNFTAPAFHGKADSLGTANGTLVAVDDGTNIKLQNTGYGVATRTLQLYGYNGSTQTGPGLTVTSGGGAQLNSLSSGGSLSGSHTFSGGGTGTFTHGLSVTPGCVSVTAEPGSGSTTTVGIDAVGSSTVHVDINGAFSFVAVATAN